MVSQEAHGYWVIVVSFLIAYVLAVLPVASALGWLRPEWLALALIYWAIALPHRVGLFTAGVIGLGMDVLEGAVLGQNMLALAVVVVLSRLLYQRLRLFSPAQQALTVFVMVGIHQLLCHWVQNIEGAGSVGFQFLLPAVSSALLWPVVLIGLRSARRYYEVT